MKKLLAILLCLVMVFSLSANAFAAPGHSHTVTIHNKEAGYVYKAYQIFEGTLGSDGVLSNVAWGTGIDGDAFLTELKKLTEFKDCADAKMVAKVLSGAKAMDDPQAIAFADLAAQFIIEGNESGTLSFDAAKGYTITGLDDGYYLIKNTDVPSDVENTTVSRYMLEVVRDINVTHKGTFPSVEKKIIEAELEVDVNQASIGEPVEYKITGTIPTTIDTYVTYYYAFEDTLSKGLTLLNEDSYKPTVTVNGVDVTKYFYFESTPYAGTEPTDPYYGGTSIYMGIQDILALENEKDTVGNVIGVGGITSKTEVVFTYYAKVNENAIIAVEGNPNKVRLVYDNDPNTEGDPTLPPPNPDEPTPPDITGITPEDEVKSYSTEITILKKDGSGKILTGAEFTITGESVKTMIVTRQVFELAGPGQEPEYYELKDGTFTTVAPVADDPATDGVNESTEDSYVSLSKTHVLNKYKDLITKATDVEVKSFVGSDGRVTFTGLDAGTYTITESVTPDGFNTIDPIIFTVEFNPETGKFSTPANNAIMDEDDNTLFVEIINVAGTTLPSTGGIGTTIFYIIGGILVAGSLIFLVTKKRMS